MTAATSRLRRRGIGAGVAALVGLSGLGLSAAIPAQAVASFDLTRPADTSDRFATAASVATSAFTTSTNVIIANGDNAVDALSASYLAGTTTPILYVTSTSVPAATAAAITKLGATNAYVVGGTTAIPDSVVASLSTTTETRIAGADRYKTAVAVGTAKAAMGVKPTTAFIARGDQFADALAIAPVAAKSGIPILLTETGSLNADTLAALKAWGITSVTIVGGPSAVSENVVTSLTAQGVTSTRIAGSTRSSTATAIANTAAFGFAKTSVYVVNGFRPVDALPAAIAAAKANAPILLTEDGVLGADTQGYLTANAGTLTGGVAVGGTTVLPTSVETAAETAAKSVASTQTIAVTPTAAVSLTATGGVESPNVTTDDRTYTVTGLTDATQYRVTLVNGANVTTTGAQTTFAIDRTAATVTSTNPDGANGQQASGNYLAQAGTSPLPASNPTARFLSVNGAPAVNNAGVGQTTSTSGVTNSAVANPVNGSLTFTIDGDAPESVVPVVYVNGGSGSALAAGGASPRLELNASGAPVEPFGIGGSTLFTLTEAALGTIATTTVAAVDTRNDFFASASATYFYDANDTFQYGGQPLTLAQFEATIGAGATVTGSYAPDAAGVSTFNITGNASVVAVGAPTTTVTNIDGGSTVNDVQVTYTRPSANASGVTYTLQRASVAAGPDNIIGNSDDVPGTYADVTGATDAVNALGTQTFTSLNTPDGYYRYRVQATPPNSTTATAGTASTANTVVPVAADTTRPQSTFADLTTSAGLGATLDAGDVVKVVFNEPLRAPASGALVRVRDADTSNSVGDLINGTNATFSLNSSSETVSGTAQAAGTVLTITVTGNPTVVSAGTATGIQIPATVIDSSGIVDVAGNTWDIASSGDKQIG